MIFRLVCTPENDLYRVMQDSGFPLERYDTLAEVASGDGPLLMLADGYPEHTTDVSLQYLEELMSTDSKCFVEYPAAVPGMDIGEPKDMQWERAVVSSPAFGPDLAENRIMMIHGCRILPVDTPDAHIIMARVAGFDTAVYGLPEERYPVLLKHPNADMLVATTKLSCFRTARYAPADTWRVVWRWVLQWLTDGETLPELDWEPSVHPAYMADAQTPSDIERTAVARGAEWFRKARLFIHPYWEDDARERLHGFHDGTGPGPEKDWLCGDGSFGMIEGASSNIRHDGSQHWRYFLRNDCMGEASMAVALSETLGCTAWGKRTAKNINDFIYTYSNLARERRANPESPSYGLVNWDTRAPFGGVYYGDDNARAMLGTMAAAAAAATGSDAWNESLLKCLLGNLRTTGPQGFRSGRLQGNDLEKHGWQHYWETERTHFAPHYESWLWACYLWAYDKTGFNPFLDRAKTGIELMMGAYPDDWHWTNGIQQERARMLLPLSWLVRVENTERHRSWLRFMADEILKFQDTCGAIREEVGGRGKGSYAPPAKNEDYGTTEAPLIQENGDPLCDLLYTTNFAFAGLHEAARATGDQAIKAAEDRLADFLCRIQVVSEEQPELDGAWFRAFEFKRWDYWASNADLGWGAWSIESGWTQSWITAVLALRQLDTSLWDFTKESRIGEHIDTLAAFMLPGVENV